LPAVDVVTSVRDRTARLRVHGERPFYVAMGELRVGAAKPFERMPVVYERAWGGVAKSLSLVELANPVGVGVCDAASDLDGTAAPQIEDLAKPYVGGRVGHVAGGCDPATLGAPSHLRRDLRRQLAQGAHAAVAA